MKRYLLLGCIVLSISNTFSQKNSLNAGFDLLGIKSSTPFGAGFHLGYEFAIPKINFMALEARIGAGVLARDGLYHSEPIYEWNYKVNYLRLGICPRFYYRMADDIDLFLDPEIGVARLSGKTYFSEQKKWNPTKTFDYNYYSIRVGAAVPITDKLKLSVAFGYSSLDITNLMNSKLSTINYRFKDQVLDIDTSITLHIIF